MWKVVVELEDPCSDVTVTHALTQQLARPASRCFYFPLTQQSLGYLEGTGGVKAGEERKKRERES